MHSGASVQLPQMTKTNAIIIAVSAGIFLLDSILVQLAGFSLRQVFGLSLLGMSQGLLFQILTHPFAPSSFFQVLFSGLILWFLGCELERQWGRGYYLFMIVTSFVIGGLAYLFVSGFIFWGTAMTGVPLAGLAGVSSGLCLVYAILYPDRQFVFMFLFPMKAKYFCMLLVAITLYQGVFSPGGVLAWGHLGTMGGAFVALRLLGVVSVRQRLGRLFAQMGMMSESFSSRSSGTQGQRRRRRNAERSNLKIVRDEKEDDDDKRPPKYWQ